MEGDSGATEGRLESGSDRFFERFVPCRPRDSFLFYGLVYKRDNLILDATLHSVQIPLVEMGIRSVYGLQV